MTCSLDRRAFLDKLMRASMAAAGTTLLAACAPGPAPPATPATAVPAKPTAGAASPAASPSPASAASPTASPAASPAASPVASPGAVAAPATRAPVASASGGPLVAARMACWSQPIAEQANVFVAQEFGWFRDEGLDFTFLPGAGGGDALKHVVAGNADFAFTNLEPVFFALDQGSKLRAIYNIYPQNVFNVLTPKNEGITRPQDLKGLKIAVYSKASGTYHNLLVLLRSAGLKESDVEIVAAGVNNFGPFLQGQVDAQATTDTGLYLARQQGLGDVDVIWVRDYLNTPADAFVVSDETYQNRKDLLRRFLRAYRRGTQWTLDNPEKAGEIAKSYATDGQNVGQNIEIVKLRNASTVNDDTRRQGLGWFDIDVLRQSEQALFDLGLTKSRIDVADVFTNEFVERS